MFFVAAPALAKQPKLTYDFGIIQFPDPANPGTTFTTGDIIHGRGAGNIGFLFGSPWGGVLSVATIGNYEINEVSFTGNGGTKIVHTGLGYIAEGTSAFKIIGVGDFIYNGPPMTASSPTGMMLTIDDGDEFVDGLLMSGISILHANADGRDLQIRVEWNAINYPGFVNILSAKATYWFTGN